MSVVPEFVLQTAIIRGIKALRADTRLIDQLFRNLSQDHLQQMRTFVRTATIDLCINFPRAPLKVPAIVILLRNEREEQAFLGDSMGINTADVFGWNDGDGAVPTGAGSVTNLSGNPTVVFGPLTASAGTRNTLSVDDWSWPIDQYLVGDHDLRIVAGKGAGQVRRIVGNSNTTIMVTPDWGVIPDTTTVFQVTRPPDEVVGEPSSLYRRDLPDFVERKGGLYAVTYQLQIFGQTPELTIYLDAILKAIFTHFRLFLEGQGVINLAMSATDYTPKPEYQPDLSYLRARNLDFIYPFDTFEQQLQPAELRLVLEGEQPDGSIVTTPVLSDTNFPLGD